ncbi:MAG TPA: endonuclease/exonuclease/phosphatase family protein [Longimicrobiales bacterium]
MAAPVVYLSSMQTLALKLLALLVACAACAHAGASPTEPSPLTQPIASQGTATTLDVANWNVEWFGMPGYGPADEGLQLRNVQAVMKGMDADVWGLAEVCDSVQFRQLVKGMPGYAGLLANDPAVRSGSAYYYATEQKVALVWRTSQVKLDSARVVLAEHDEEFAGRPPVEFHLHVTIDGHSEPLVVLVMHAKAGADLASWQRRAAAAQALKAYLDATWPTQKVLVIGDFNDLGQGSIASGQASPYRAFVSDSAHYSLITLALQQAGLSSETDYPSVIDQQLATNELAADYVPGSVEAFRADQYVAAYRSTTSDHFPVLARYRVP